MITATPVADAAEISSGCFGKGIHIAVVVASWQHLPQPHLRG